MSSFFKLVAVAPRYQLSVNQLDANLWLGNIEAAQDIGFLFSNNITRILACGIEFEARNEIPRLQLMIRDNEWDDNTEAEFRKGAKQLGEWLDAGERVLVHCMAGVSRSTTVVLLDMMLRKGMPLLNAVETVQSKRHKIGPVTSYWKLLLRVEKEREEMKLLARHGLDHGTKALCQNSILCKPSKDTTKRDACYDCERAKKGLDGHHNLSTGLAVGTDGQGNVVDDTNRNTIDKSA